MQATAERLFNRPGFTCLFFLCVYLAQRQAPRGSEVYSPRSVLTVTVTVSEVYTFGAIMIRGLVVESEPFHRWPLSF